MELERYTIRIKPRYELSDKEYDKLTDDMYDVLCPVVLKNIVVSLLYGVTDHELIIEVENPV